MGDLSFHLLSRSRDIKRTAQIIKSDFLSVSVVPLNENPPPEY
jgi:hypothetical protein